MSNSTVRLKFSNSTNQNDNNKKNICLYWPASHVPVNPKFTIETTSTNKTVILAKDYVQFCSDDKCNEDVNYFVATRNKNGKFVCTPSKIYRMLPNYSFKDVAAAAEQNESIRLTKREQMDELKEKFGSRKSQRDLASKRKYEIQFGENDVDNLPSVRESELAENDGTTDEVKEQKSLSSILPERNPNAKRIEDVYSLQDIITDVEQDSINEHCEELFVTIKNNYIKKLGEKFEDKKHRMITIYADLLLQLVKLSAYEMRKVDPLPSIVGDIKNHLLARYTSTKNISSRSHRYVITDQNKDRLFANIFLLVIILNNYKSIDLEHFQSNFKIPLVYIRRLLEVIGCYIENVKKSNGIVTKTVRFCLPLNLYKEPKLKRFKR